MPLKQFFRNGLSLAFLEEGKGPPVLLIHGFASNHSVNWVGTGWVKALTGAGRRVIAIDNRGHGKSAAVYNKAAYTTDIMAADALALLDHLKIERAVVMGYSMGARISAFLALAAPHRVEGLVLSGLAANLIRGVGGAAAIADALKAPSAASVTDPTGRAFRVFADQTGSDRAALAACIMASRQTLSEADAARIAVPTLVVAGENDPIAGPVAPLADLIPGAKPVTLPGRDHMSAVGDKGHKEAVLAFLDRVGAG